MDNEIHALEIGVGIVLFCIGITLLLTFNRLYNTQFQNLENHIFENHMISTSIER